MSRKFDTVFFLTAEVRADSAAPSGYRFVEEHPTGGAMYSKIRYDGMASLTRLRYAERYVIVGGKGGQQGAFAAGFKSLLEKELGAVGDIFADDHDAAATTELSMPVIAEMLPGAGRAAIVTSFYHVPRTHALARAADIEIPVYPSEAFLLIEHPERGDELLTAFGGGAFAERAVNEIRGIASILSRV